MSNLPLTSTSANDIMVAIRPDSSYDQMSEEIPKHICPISSEPEPEISQITPGTAEKVKVRDEHQDTGSSKTKTVHLGFVHRTKQKRWNYAASRNVMKRWLAEIISWSLSALAMGGIVLVLYHYQHQPLPRWPHGLTLNAYISVLAKFSVATLLLPVSEALGQLKWIRFVRKSEISAQSKKMWDFELFEKASNGPWGSFLLLLSTRGRSMAALGAAITVFALAMDPFVQQVVKISGTWQELPTKALIPRATTYTAYTAGKLILDGNSALELDQAMSATLYFYFYDNGTVPVSSGNRGINPTISLSCPSTNCTWPRHESLSICNRCGNVIDRLEFGCRRSVLDWIPNPTPLPDHTNWDYPNGTACGWYLMADPPILMTGYTTGSSINQTGEVLISRSQPLYDVFTRVPLSGYAAKLNNTRNPISHFVIVSGGSAIEVRQNVTPIAHECILSWCAKTMQSTVFQGAYTENVTDIVFNKTLGRDPWTTFVQMDGNETIATIYKYTENVTIVGNNGFKYTISNTTHTNILSIFDDVFPSTFTVTNTTEMDQAALRIQQYKTTAYQLRNKYYNPFLYDNITSHLDNMASDLTNIVRSAKRSVEMIPGPAYELVSVVEVRWEWLSLPLGLLFSSLVFLVATIVRSSMAIDHVGTWKTSVIATLLYGLPENVGENATTANNKEIPLTDVKNTRVKWPPGIKWRVSDASAVSPSS